MPTTEQGFSYANSIVREMSDFFETRVENLQTEEAKEKSFTAAKKVTKKRKGADSNYNAVKSSEESSVER